MKRFTSLILAVMFTFSFIFGLNFNASAATVVASGTYDNGNAEFAFSWSLDSDGVITISGNGKRVDNFSAGSAPWYQYREQIKRLVVEEGVVQLGAYSFYDLPALESIDFGTIDTLGDHAFQNCVSLETISFPSQLNWMYTAGFQGCTSLRSAYLGERWWNSDVVPDWFFEGCTSLAVIKMGSNYTGFGSDALTNCNSLKAVITDNTDINSSGGYTVYRTNQLSGVCSTNTYSSQNLTWNYDISTERLYFTGSGDMTAYENGSQPWQNFTGAVTKVDFSTTDAKTSVSTTAFQGREVIETVDFTNIYAIGWGAFAECYSVGSVQFDNELTAIWNYAFANDTSIEQVRFTEGSDDLHIYPYAFNNCTGTTFWIDLPANTRYIDQGAFWNTGFNYVKIFSQNVTMGDDAFGNGEGGWAQFLGVGGMSTGVYDWVKAHQNRGYNWKYWCMNDQHAYTTQTVAPTCTEQGYDLYSCPFCDTEGVKSNYTPALGHKYSYTSSDGMMLVYSCTQCGRTDIRYNALDAKSLFRTSVSVTAGDTRYNQFNYDGRIDLDNNGVVNARDLVRVNNVINSPDLTNKETTFDVNTQYQTIEGFGASAAWWAQSVGQWDNAEDIISLLYSKDEGIGLNIYRYNLGAGSEDQHDTGLYVENARTHCFMQSDGTYNWNNDPGAMNCLSIARTLNPNLKVTLFANSAPYFMTKNGKTYGALTDNGSGGYSGTENLDSSRYQDFANYIVTCAEHFRSEGYNVTSVSPINEPEWDWSGWYNGDGTQSSNQEGCHFDETSSRTFFNDYMVPAVTNSTLNGKTGVDIWECGQINHNWWWWRFLNQHFSSKDAPIEIGGWSSGTDYNDNNRNIRGYVDALAAHSYWASTSDREQVAGHLSEGDFGQKVRSTEYCQMTNDASTGVLGHIQAEGGSTNGMTIDYGLALADIIYQDMTILNSIEWDWWTACGRGVYPDSLIYISDSNHDNIQPSKRLWCLGNYSKFIEEGAKRISVSTGSAFGSNLTTNQTYSWSTDYDSGVDKNNYIEQSAYLNPDGSVVIVYINNSDSYEYTTFTDTAYSEFKTYVTDAGKDLELYQHGKIGDTVVIPSKSVTTVVLRNGKTPVASTDGAYLFAYFTGNSQSEQTVHLAVSNAGYSYTPLNGNNAVIQQTKGTLCCRDPYIFKGQDNYYYIIATDMDASGNQWWGNSNSMVIWRSADLSHWNDETIIHMNTVADANDVMRCWAPQVIWDSKEQKYMVYFALASGSITNNKTVMYYCYTDDLLDESKYSAPQLLYKPDSGLDAIDGDIIFDSKSKTYYLYYKDESNATICYVKSKNLTGPYGDAANPKRIINSNVGLEGCNCFFMTGTDALEMIADAYGDGYFVMAQSIDFENFYLLDSDDYSLNNCSPRHGSIIPIKNSEYNNLVRDLGY